MLVKYGAVSSIAKIVTVSCAVENAPQESVARAASCMEAIA